MKGTVLIVDDAPANLALLLDTLGGAGLELRFAESGERALVQLDHALTPPDLILLDVLMSPGGLDGFETCRRIRARKNPGNGNVEVPVLFMTALGDPADTLRGFAAGAVDYIIKPFRPEEVLARVRVHLQLRALRRALEEEAGRRARAEEQLRESLDRAVLVADRDWRVQFCSRPACEVLARHFPAFLPERDHALPAELRRLAAEQPTASPRAVEDDDRGGLRVRLFSEVNDGGCVMLLLEELLPPADAGPLLAGRLGLTPREAEVLLWVARAKTTAEIAAILDTSPKTVTKHLEHIFDKLGVDSRTAAACRALEVLGPGVG